MIVRPMEPLDTYRIRLRADGPPGWRSSGPALIKAGPAWAAVDSGTILALAGLVLHWQGRAGAWCMIGADLPTRAWPALTAHVRRRLGEARRELRLRRVEAEALAGWAPGARWLELLGFRPEGTMPAYGHDGADYDRWSLLAREN